MKALTVFVIIAVTLELLCVAGWTAYYTLDGHPISCRYSITVPQMYNATTFKYHSDMGGNASRYLTYTDGNYTSDYCSFPTTITDSDEVGSKHHIDIIYYKIDSTPVVGTNIVSETYVRVGTYHVDFQTKEIADQVVSQYGGEYWIRMGLSCLLVFVFAVVVLWLWALLNMY